MASTEKTSRFFWKRSVGIFGDGLSRHFCEIVATSMLGNRASQLFPDLCTSDDEWFGKYYDGLEHFDYIVPVARKGLSGFRAYLRLLKELADEPSEFRDAARASPLLNSRTMCFFTFNYDSSGREINKPMNEIKVLVFDDMINKGRNIARMVRDLVRQGILIENIYIATLGYNALQLSEPSDGDCHSTWITQGEDKVFGDESFATYLLNFRDEGSDDLSSVKVFLSRGLANCDFMDTENVFLSRSNMNERSKNLLSFCHYALLPYTDYMAYAYLNGSDLVGFKDWYTGFSEKSCDIGTEIDCDDEKISGRSFKVRSQYKNGFYLALRIFHNSDTDEYLLYPCVILPTMTGKQITKVYKTLFAGMNYGDYGKYNAMISMVLGSIQGNGNVDVEGMRLSFNSSSPEFETKWVLEHMSRSVICVMSAVEAIRFLVDQGMSDEVFLVRKFSEYLKKQFGIRKYGDQDFTDFLKKCLQNYKSNQDVFCFESTEHFGNINPSLNEYPKYRFDSIKREDEEIRKCTEKLRKELDTLPKELEFLTYGSEQERYKAVLGFAVDKLAKIDEYSRHKVPPLPTYRFVEECISVLPQVKRSDLFDELMAALESIEETGKASGVQYAGYRKDGASDMDSFICMNGIQSGERAIDWAATLLDDMGGWKAVMRLREVVTIVGVNAADDIFEREIEANKDDEKVWSELSRLNYILRSNNFWAYSMESERISDEVYDVLRSMKPADMLLFVRTGQCEAVAMGI